ncbi:MAG: mannose-1-phosphate guanylyltransferase [Actinomycetes bacterium]
MSEAVLLVGGQGSRLRPLTVRTPKPMLPVAGVPFLTHVLLRARAAGVDHVILATSYRPEVFALAFGDGAELGLHIEYVQEREPLGTGGAIRNVADRLQARGPDPILVLNGDILSDHDLGAQLEWHDRTGADVTLHLVRVGDPRAFGSVVTDPAGRVLDFCEKSPTPVTDQVNAGCYVFRRSVIDSIPAGRVVSVERETFPGLLASGAVLSGFLAASYWRDLGTPTAYVAGSADLVTGRCGSPALPRGGGPYVVSAGARVDPSARLQGGTSVGAGAQIGPGTVVDGSVIQPGAWIGAGVQVRASVVGAGAVVEDGVVLDETAIGDGAVVGAGNELRGGARVWCDVALPACSIRFSSDEE